MRFLIAPDSFKNCLSAEEVCDAIAKGILKAAPNSEIIKVPMADGGEGTTSVIAKALGADIIHCTVTGPLPKKVTAFYALDHSTAIIEVAQACGITYTTAKNRNPFLANSYGVGELINDALDHGAKHFIIGLGGSATNDGGFGMAQALGVRFYDQNNTLLKPAVTALAALARIDTSKLNPKLAQADFKLACDVTSPLTGHKGASFVFGPQKGAQPDDLPKLDALLKHYGTLVAPELMSCPGAGAAGGLGFAMMAFLKAKRTSGAVLVADTVSLFQKAQKCDVVFTGEGSTDFQTAFGKTPMVTVQIAKKASPNCLAIGLSGHLGDDLTLLYEKGFDAFFSIVNGPQTLDEALLKGADNLTQTAENITRLILSQQSKYFKKGQNQV
ncbi:glycerate kinase [Ligilactobacillus sp. WC1T17]|uniref:Glycerate kinase n=1 Tax=Ligilactobacillus ruminis TaxID=1623 RepID=A0ABY1ACS0_9LACO|nr:glycerate kinase [Ligilactobacillus ruminis]